MQRNSTDDMLRYARIAATLLFAVYAVLLATHSPQGFPAGPATHSFWPWLADKPLNEDGFYMLTVADNFATGHGLAYNFGPPVTGIQPLSTFVFAAIAFLVHHSGGDRWTLIRFILLFGAATHLLFAWLIARFAAVLAPASQRPFVKTLAFFLLLCDLTVFRLQTCGLETGIYLCLLAACVTLWHSLVSTPSTRTFVLFGIIGGFAGLARIDFGLVYAFLLLYLLVKRIGTPWQTLLSGALALLIVSPWFLYVRHITGGWMPTSGSVESGFAHQGFDRFIAWSLALLAHLAPWSYAAISHTATTALALASVVILLLLLRNAPQTRALLETPAVRNTLLPWAVAMAALSVVYAVTFQSTFFYVRYFVPSLLVTVPVIALLLSEQVFLQRRPLLPLVALTVLFSAQLLATLHRGGFGNPRFLAGAYLVRTFPGVHIGAWQSGVIGYLDPDAENLDGKLSAAAYHATMNHTLDSFIDTEGINVLTDWSGYIHVALPDTYLDRYWQPCPHPRPNADDVCYIRKSFLATHPEFR
jgi:hypothetical protein